MGQIGFFDLSKRYTGLDAKNEPLAKIDEVVPWEDFRGCLDAVCRRSDKARKSRAGRKPWDAVVMFKTIILSALYNLSDDQVEHQIRDRLSFIRFLGLGLEDRVPDAKTVWLYREQLTQAGVIETLFETFDGHLKDQGYLAMGGQIIDSSIVAVPKQRNSRKENAGIKAGETPECWQDKPAKRRQKDVEARWTKKHGRSHYGYKNHVNVDRRHKLVRRYQVSDAATHDSKVLDDILDGDNTALGVWADSAYRSAEIEAALKKKGLRSRIHRKARRNKPLSEREKQGNKTRSSVRVRVEHVFGAQSNDMGGTLLRSVGLARAKARIGLKNLAHNMRRLVQLTASPRRCDNTLSRRSPGHGLEAEIAQLERGKLPEIPVPAWPQTATARLTNHPLSNREFLEVPHISVCRVARLPSANIWPDPTTRHRQDLAATTIRVGAQEASGIRVAGNISAPMLAATLAADTCMESRARWA